VSTLITNLPPKKVWVDKSYLTAGEEDGWVEGYWVSVKSVPGSSFLFETYIPQMGALYDKLPIKAFCADKALETEEHDNLLLQPWDCFGMGVTILEKNLLSGCEVEARIPCLDLDEDLEVERTIETRRGTYLFTIDNYATENPDLTFSHILPEHKSFNVIELETGQFALLPNNLVTFKVSSLYWKEPEPIKLKACPHEGFYSEGVCWPLGRATRSDYSDAR
jgi:hypothetical protein